MTEEVDLTKIEDTQDRAGHLKSALNNYSSSIEKTLNEL
jgi:hypothetical protein